MLGAADDDDVCLAAANHFGAELHGFGGGCARETTSVSRCACALRFMETAAALPFGHEHKYGHAGRTRGAPRGGCPMRREGPHATDAGTEGYAGAFGVDFFALASGPESCVFPCFSRAAMRAS